MQPSDHDITRRRLVALGLAAAGAGALGPAGPALAGGPRATSVVLRLPYARRSGTIAVPGGLELAGLRWPGAAHASAELRARRRGGRWSPWLPLHAAHDHGPDGPAGRGGGTDPVWTGPADEVEVRLSRPVRGLALHGVRTHGARGAVRPRAAAAQAGGPPVRIITRSEWGGDQVPPRAAPDFGDVRMAFVHHTVNANDYGPEDSAGIVLAIARYHRNSNGWNDVGYNFLVDRYGQVFEGRAGGIDQPVVGAQAQGYNAMSTGVANIGTFESVAQTPEALDAMAKLIAWKLGVHGAPVEGEVTVTSRGGESNRYPSGRQVVFQRIAGHREGDKTSCPGSALFGQLGELRERAAAEQRRLGGPRTTGSARLTLAAASTRVELPAEAQVSGALVGVDGAPVSGRRIALQVQGGRRWVTVARTTTGDDGTFGATMPVRRNGRIRAHYGGAGGGTVVSSPVAMSVVPALAARASARRVKAGRAIGVTVDVSPYRPKVLVSVHRQLPGGRYVAVGTVRPRVRNGRARATVRLRKPGLYRLVASAPGDRRAVAASAPWVFVRAIR